MIALNVMGIIYFFIFPFFDIAELESSYRFGVVVGIVWPYLVINIFFVICGFNIEPWFEKYSMGLMDEEVTPLTYDQVAGKDTVDDYL